MCKKCSKNCLRSYFVVIGSMLSMFVMGIAITFGNLDPYLASYLSYISLPENTPKNVCTVEIAELYQSYLTKVPWVYSIVLVFQALLGPIGGKLDVLLGPRLTTSIGGTIMVIGLILTRFTCNNLIYFGITLGVIFGSGFGISFTGVILASTSWWPHRRGIVTGLVLASMGLGVTAFNSIQTHYINPKNLPISENGCGYILHYDNVIIHIPSCFIILGMITFICFAIGISLMSSAEKYRSYIDKVVVNEYTKLNKNKKLNINLHTFDTNFLTMTPTRLYTNRKIVYSTPINYGALTYSTNSFFNRNNNKQQFKVDTAQKLKTEFDKSMVFNDQDESIQYGTCEAIRTIKFWQLFIIATLNYTLNVFFLAQWKVLCQSYFNIIDDMKLLIIGNISAMIYALGRLFWGIYFDMFGKSKNQFKIAMGTLTILMIFFTIMTPIGKLLSINNQFIFCVIWIPLIFFVIGATYVMMPATIAKTFGVMNSGVIFGFLTFMEIPSAIAPMLIYKFLHTSWFLMLVVLAALAGCSFVLSIGYTTVNLKKRMRNTKKVVTDSPF